MHLLNLDPFLMEIRGLVKEISPEERCSYVGYISLNVEGPAHPPLLNPFHGSLIRSAVS